MSTTLSWEPFFAGGGGWFAELLIRRLDEITDQLAVPLPTIHTLPLPAIPSPESAGGRHTPADSTAWATVIAHELAAPLDLAYSENDSEEAPRRHRAIDRMTTGVADGPELVRVLQGAHASLDRIVTMAAAALQVSTALVTVLGPDKQWHVARCGNDDQDSPLEEPFYTVAVRTGEPHIVPDASFDPRLADNPAVTASGGLRYYTGVPLHDPQGRYFGALWVYDSRPRNLTTASDMTLLRKLASTAQSTIWTAIYSEGAFGSRPVSPAVEPPVLLLNVGLATAPIPP